ncbi:unnamed protein product (macronuclear) [Paramecium tetraurelia]|uniref:Protein kinase domain-containing protein n=1 Tax=Paramecium tetraurelia TaxID=5888 RepID=A0C7V3_PARTE|nr:uncharacterized protein GSPATT00036001001 [Paramecium tetraurelia]CAK66870.1 unnamed protein product [Paramecium tetraurelia]|eukprot:XP_001434267.1 hypothetical protein (macronuclear) [Paramecium tetraurelia strain d4-2]
MKSDFICLRKHLFRDSIYHIDIQNDKLLLLNTEGLTKYSISLNWSVEISWNNLNSDPAFGLVINQKIKWFHAKPKIIETLRTTLKKRITSTDFQVFYNLGSHISKGQNSYCYEFISNGDYQLNYVAKLIKQEQIRDINQLYNELNILKILNHQGLPKLVEFFRTNNTYYIVMEKIEGQKLSRLNSTKKQQLSLIQIQSIIIECLKILQYLEQIQVIHRDIQPDNIIYDQKLQTASVRLIDFAKASISGSDQKILGTPGFIAPEILRENKYSTESDMFSLGCVFYKLLVKQDLFQGVSRDDTLKENQKCLFNLRNLQLIRIPQSAQHLLSQMLQIDPKQRIKPIEALNHHFFKENMDNLASPKIRAKNLSLHQSIHNLDAILTSPSQNQLILLDQQIRIDYFQNELPPINQVPVMKQVKGGYRSSPQTETDTSKKSQTENISN